MQSPSAILQDTPEAYYWVGFILADGSVNKNGRLAFKLAKRDESQVRRFATFIGLSYERVREESARASGFTIQCDVIREAMLKFGIKPAKSYNPPDLAKYESLDSQLLLSLIIGYIDGDGHIGHQTGRRECAIRFHVHSSWLTFLSMVAKPGTWHWPERVGD